MRSFSTITMGPCLVMSTVLLGFFAAFAVSAPVHTATLICVPTRWLDIFAFFGFNYIAYAVTIPAAPGVKWYDTVFWTIICLALPFAGLGKSLAMIFRYIWQNGKRDDLELAFTLNAVLIVRRSEDWEPVSHEDKVYVKLPSSFNDLDNSGVTVESVTVRHTEVDYMYTLDPGEVNIHGRTVLPKGYKLGFPEANWYLRSYIPYQSDRQRAIRLSRSQSWLKIAVSIAQLIYSSATLYHTKGDQISRYGYAAFGLTVFPYTIMSFANLVCVGLVGEYPYVYILRDEVLREAERRGGTFDGAIGVTREMEMEENSNYGDDNGQRNMQDKRKFTEGFNAAWLSMVEQSSADVKEKMASDCGEEQMLSGGTHVEDPNRMLVDARDEDRTSAEEGDQGIPRASAGSLAETEKILSIRVGQTTKRFKFQRKTSDPSLSDSNFCIHVGNDNDYLDNKDAGWALFLMGIFLVASPIVIFSIPYVFIFLLSGFKAAGSTVAERAWTMTWLCSNQLALLYFSIFGLVPHLSLFNDVTMRTFTVVVSTILGVPAIGGLVTVGKMLVQFGTCSSSP